MLKDTKWEEKTIRITLCYHQMEFQWYEMALLQSDTEIHVIST
jgi:hypothetical protein